MSVQSRSRLVSVAAGVAFAATSFLGLASSAHAASLTSAQISSIVNLLQTFGADPSVVANVQSVLEGTTPSSTTTPASSNGSGSSITGSTCSVVSTDLHLGDVGEAVSKLQTFLAKDKTIYPAGQVTGYFGSMTEDAVKRWQAAHNVVATGTPDTTGYGVVGPHTRGEMDKEMETECGDSGSSSSDNGNASATSSESSGSSDTSASSTSSSDN